MMPSSLIYFFYLNVALTISLAVSQPNRPVLSGHSHNDYQQTRPLWDAIDNKFISVEADIHLSGKSLLVGHDPEDLDTMKTLQSLYLDPLRSYIANHDGWVYSGYELLLFIDIKTDADSTYIILSRVLSTYSDIITDYSADHITHRAIAVVISGNRPLKLMNDEKIRYCTYDGRLADLDKDMPANFMLLVSDNWQRHFRWRGRGPMSDSERDKLAKLISTAHAKGYRIRFWNLPTSDPAYRNNIWTELISAGVDLINVDNLKAYHDFLADNLLNQ